MLLHHPTESADIDPMGGIYRGVLGRRDVLVVLVPYVLARLPLSMSLLAVLLLVRGETGSYHDAGLVCAAYGLSVAMTAPLLGRLVDRHGQEPVLVRCGLVHPAAMTVLAIAAARHLLPLVLVGAVLAGVSLPPVSSCMRVLWGFLLARDVAVGYAIEGVVVETAELTGPLLVSAAILVSGPVAAVICSGATTGLATLLFSRSPASRAATVEAERRGRPGPLAVGGVRLVLFMVGAMSVTVGGVEVGITAFARAQGGPASAGLYIALVSVGGIIAGLLAGGRASAGRAPRVALGAASLATAGAATALAAASATAALVPLLLAFGAVVALACIVQLAFLAKLAPAAVRTEAFTWGATANFIGLAAGDLLAGFVVDGHGIRMAVVAAAVPSILAAAVPLVVGNGGRAVDAPEAGVGPRPETVTAAFEDEIMRLRAQNAQLRAALAQTTAPAQPRPPASSVAPGRPVLLALPGIGLTPGPDDVRYKASDDQPRAPVDDVLEEAADADTR